MRAFNETRLHPISVEFRECVIMILDDIFDDNALWLSSQRCRKGKRIANGLFLFSFVSYESLLYSPLHQQMDQKTWHILEFFKFLKILRVNLTKWFSSFFLLKFPFSRWKIHLFSVKIFFFDQVYFSVHGRQLFLTSLAILDRKDRVGFFFVFFSVEI